MRTSFHLFEFLKNRELDELYVSMAIRSFALALIDLFIPIYLLTLDYSLKSVFLFFVFTNIIQALFVFPAAKISARYGFKHSILYSVPLLIIFYLMLATLETERWPLFMIAVIGGAAYALFWLAYHVDFAKFSDQINRGKEVGFAGIVSDLFTVPGPILGGILAVWLGFPPLFLIVSVLLSLSVFPLFLSRDTYEPTPFSFRQVFTDQKARDYLGFTGGGIEGGASLILWPIFLFTSIVSNLPLLGSIRSLLFLVSIIFAGIFSGLSDWKRELVLRFGALANSLVAIARLAARTATHAFMIDGFYGITRSAVFIPFDAISYDRANKPGLLPEGREKSNLVEYIAFREIMWHLGQAGLFMVMFFVADFTVGFLLGAAASLLIIFF